jgi:glycosyltransferase involved in cell wall biosynthesis
VKILLVSERLSGRSDEGIKNLALALLRELSAGHELLALSGRSAEGDARFTRVPMNPFFFNRELLSQVRRFGPDAILYVPWTSGTARTFWRARVLKIAAAAPVAVFLTQPYRAPRWERTLKRVLVPDLVLGMGEETIRESTAAGARTEFVPAGVDLAKFTIPSVEQRTESRRRLDIAAEERLILHVGHLSPQRMDSGEMRRMAQRPGWKLLVVGSPETTQDPELIALLTDAGARVIREYLPKIEAVYAAADVYLFPTWDPRNSIGVPLSVLEALACGLPVVSTPFEGLPRLFPDTPYVRFTADASQMEAHLAAAPAAGASEARALVEPLEWSRVAARVEGLLGEMASERRRGSHRLS